MGYCHLLHYRLALPCRFGEKQQEFDVFLFSCLTGMVAICVALICRGFLEFTDSTWWLNEVPDGLRLHGAQAGKRPHSRYVDRPRLPGAAEP